MTKLNTKHIDKTYWILFGILIVCAIVSLFSASSTLVYASSSTLGPITHQGLFIIMGVVAAYILQFVPSRIIMQGGKILWVLSVIILYSMLLPKNPFVVTINGAGRWFSLFGLTFQPSELAKLSLIIVISFLLSQIKTEEDNKKYFWITLTITGITVLPVLVGNLSTAMLMCGIVGLLWILANIPWKYILGTIGVAVVLLLAGYFYVEYHFVRQGRPVTGLFSRAETWVSRIDNNSIDTSDDFRITDDNYQASIAKVAIMRGGKSPIGVLPGRSQERDYLPLAYADYIFAIIVEETGIIGAIFLCLIYLAVLCRACLVSNKYADYDAMLMTMGLALMVTCQALISMMVAVGIFPVTGQPLPMISKGGTSVTITAIYFGILMSVAREQSEMRERDEASQHANYEHTKTITLDE